MGAVTIKISSILQKQASGLTYSRLFFSRGDIIFNDEDHASCIFFVESGLVGIIKSAETGIESILRLHSEDDFFGYRPFFTDKIHKGTAMCIEKSVIAKIDYNTFKIISGESQLLTYFLTDLSEKMLLTEKRFSESTAKGVKTKIAEALVFLSTRYPEHRWTKKEIAEFCGSTTATVIRTLSEFQKQGLINQSADKLVITSLEALLNSQGFKK